jgi:uncharacterized protein (DUF952 family)
LARARNRSKAPFSGELIGGGQSPRTISTICSGPAGHFHCEGQHGVIYKILRQDEWQAFRAAGEFSGAPVDLKDGFIHFSNADQVEETARRHFAGLTGLVLVAVDPAKLGDALKYEVSRGGALFPHFFGTLKTAHIAWAKPLPLGADGAHQFEGLLA